jgi:allophanate hydrolase
MDDGPRGEGVAAALARIAAHHDPAVWISVAAPEAIGVAAASGEGPLAGVPFGVKDNIDVAGLPTTAGCPAYARTPDAHAVAVDLLVRAGAVPVGKTNLDQFATGLVGTRSPYGTPVNPFDPTLVPGGSSSGSGVAVATGLVPFALGTDTAGSGRVPAAVNNVVGLKPTRGLVSGRGVVPACWSLDCVSVFALTVADAAGVLAVIDRHDPLDIYARPLGERTQRPAQPASAVVVGVPDDASLGACDASVADAFARQLEELRALGVRLRPVDLQPFLAVGDLLYDGPWVAERLAAVGSFIEAHPDDVLPVTRSIITGAARFGAVDAFAAEYRRRTLALEAAAAWATVDAIVVPTVPRIPTVAEVAADPVGVNMALGRYTTFANLLDLCAVATPGGFTAAGRPAGFTLLAPACHDRFLLGLADAYERLVDRPAGALGVRPERRAVQPLGEADERTGTIPVAVVGAHLTGQPLNGELTGRGAHLSARTTTAPCYRLFALAGTVPPKPGLLRAEGDPGAAAIEVEVWDVPGEAFGSFVAGVPAPLAIGKLELADGRWVSGFVCEPAALADAVDITAHGGWRAYLSARTRSPG